MRIVRPWDTPANAARYGVVEGGAVREIGLAISKAPVLFLKPPSSLIGHLEPIQYPRETWRLESEGELTVPHGAGHAGTPSSAWMAELRAMHLYGALRAPAPPGDRKVAINHSVRSARELVRALSRLGALAGRAPASCRARRSRMPQAVTGSAGRVPPQPRGASLSLGK